MRTSQEQARHDGEKRARRDSEKRVGQNLFSGWTLPCLRSELCAGRLGSELGGGLRSILGASGARAGVDENGSDCLGS
jgi:hypothetical protein